MGGTSLGTPLSHVTPMTISRIIANHTRLRIKTFTHLNLSQVLKVQPQLWSLPVRTVLLTLFTDSVVMYYYRTTLLPPVSAILFVLLYLCVYDYLPCNGQVKGFTLCSTYCVCGW